MNYLVMGVGCFSIWTGVQVRVCGIKMTFQSIELLPTARKQGVFLSFYFIISPPFNTDSYLPFTSNVWPKLCGQISPAQTWWNRLLAGVSPTNSSSCLKMIYFSNTMFHIYFLCKLKLTLWVYIWHCVTYFIGQLETHSSYLFQFGF